MISERDLAGARYCIIHADLAKDCPDVDGFTPVTEYPKGFEPQKDEIGYFEGARYFVQRMEYMFYEAIQ